MRGEKLPLLSGYPLARTAEISFDGEVPLPPNVRPVIILKGSDYDLGYQYYQQLVQIFGMWVLSSIAHNPFSEKELAALKAYQWYIKQHAPEFIYMLKGMADAANDAGVSLSYIEVLAHFTGTESYTGVPPESKDEQLPEGNCSGFAAWGDATKDGKLICAGCGDHSTDSRVTLSCRMCDF